MNRSLRKVLIRLMITQFMTMVLDFLKILVLAIKNRFFILLITQKCIRIVVRESTNALLRMIDILMMIDILIYSYMHIYKMITI